MSSKRFTGKFLSTDKPLWAMLLFTLLLALSAHQILFVDHSEEFARTALGELADGSQETELPAGNKIFTNIIDDIFVFSHPLLVVLFVISFVLCNVRKINQTTKFSPRAPPISL